MKKIKTKILSYFVCCTILFSCFSTPLTINAVEDNQQNKLVDSIGSITTDINQENILGEDKNQEKKTEYSQELNNNYLENYTPEIDENGNILNNDLQTDVYVTQTTSFSIYIPKTIIIGGQEKNAEYVVGAKGDISGLGAICIIPKSSFYMYDIEGIKSKEVAHVSQEITKFTNTKEIDKLPTNAINTLNNEKITWVNGNMYCLGLTAGSWSGVETFIIGYIDDFTKPIEYASDGSIFSIDTNTILIQEEYSGVTFVNTYINGIPTNDAIVSENSDIIRIENNGIVLEDNAIAGDVANVTFTLPYVDNDGIEGRNEISITAQVVVFSLSMDTSLLTLNNGKKEDIQAIVVPVSLKDNIIWDVVNDENFSLEIDEQDNSKATIYANKNVQTFSLLKTGNIDVETNGLVTATIKGYDSNTIVIINEEEICDHEYKQTIIDKPTCIKGGLVKYECSKCKDWYEKYLEIDTTAHVIGTDNHHCSFCGVLMKQYAVGETITRKVANQMVNFICINANHKYINENNEEDIGALFFATTVLKPEIAPWNTTNDGVAGGIWANSDARETLNKDNNTNDFTYLSKVNTTENYYYHSATGVNSGVSGKFPTLSLFTKTTIQNPILTYDYFFPLSIEEAVNNNKYVAYFYGSSNTSSNSYLGTWYSQINKNSTPYGYAFRTTASNTSDRTLLYYFAGTDMVCNWFLQGNSGYATMVGQRPACVISQNVGFAESTAPTKEITYQIGDKMSKVVAGEKITFTCIDEDYQDATGNNIGALFLADEVLPIKYATSSSNWSNSNVRELLNSNNSDTTNLVSVNTTVKTAGTSIPDEDWRWRAGANIDEMKPIAISSKQTIDKYFVLSIEELCKYVGYINSTDAVHRDIQKESLNNGLIGYCTRTSYYYSSTNEYFVNLLTNVPRVTYKLDNSTSTAMCANDLIGVRPACVLPQN